MQLVSKKEVNYFKWRVCENPLNILLTIIFIFSKPGVKAFFSELLLQWGFVAISWSGIDYVYTNKNAKRNTNLIIKDKQENNTQGENLQSNHMIGLCQGWVWWLELLLKLPK